AAWRRRTSPDSVLGSVLYASAHGGPEGVHAHGRRRHDRALPWWARRQGRARPRRVRRRRRGGPGAGGRPGTDRRRCGAARAAAPAPARAVRRRRGARDRARQARSSRTRCLPRHPRDGDRPRAAHRRRDHTFRSTAGVRGPGRERARGSPRPCPHCGSARRAPGGRGPRRRLARRQPGGAVPQSTRRPRVHAGTLAGARLPSRPHRSQLSATQEVPVPLTFTIAAPPADRVEADLLAVPVGAERALGPGADVVDAALDGDLGAFMEEADFDGKPEQTLAVPTRGRLGAAAALLVGVGPFDDVTGDGLRRAAAAIARRATRAPSVATTLVDLADGAGLERPDAAQALAEGFVLGAYQFLKYKADGDASQLAEVIVVTRAGARVEAALERGATIAGAVTWARDMVNEPSGAKSPAAFADAAKKLLRGKGVTVKVMTEAELEAEGLGGVVGVGQGSSNPPRLVKATYTPTGKKSGSVALVGKGVVFDSGGLSLKTSSGMETMKTDMSGAAAVLATMSVLKALDVKAKVTAYVPMVENMPSGTAIRPGDVL